MFQHKTDEMFRELSDVIGMNDEILIEGYDAEGKDHDIMLSQIMQICHKEKP